MKETKLKINGMMCEGCENRVKSAVSLIEGVEKVEADHNTGTLPAAPWASRETPPHTRE